MTTISSTVPAAPGAPPDADQSSTSPERIADLATMIAGRVGSAIGEIATITTTTRLLSLNAQIEAARAGGTTGAAFAVVASAMQDLSGRTRTVADEMANETRKSIEELERIARLMATHVRGERLSDMALTNIDLIDRCLYERTCDCRWWATDSSVVDALTTPTPASIEYASKRMSVILDAYTVYYDLVLADTSGRILANGRPGAFRSVGTNCSDAEWFRSSMATRSGADFGFQGAHASPLVGDQRTLIYSAGVRAGAATNGKLLGVLGVVFNWDGLAQKIVENTLPKSEDSARVCIVDNAGLILADSKGRQLHETIHFAERDTLFKQKKGFAIARIGGDQCVIAHGLSPGFETYATGWHSLIVQPIK